MYNYSILLVGNATGAYIQCVKVFEKPPCSAMSTEQALHTSKRAYLGVAITVKPTVTTRATGKIGYCTHSLD